MEHMTVIMKPKHALVKDGFLPKGSENQRGRLSKAAIERCKVLVSEGWNIEGYSVSDTPAPVSVSAPAAPKVVKAEAPANVKQVLDFSVIYERDAYKAVAANGVYGMAEVCNNCRVSLVQCHCGDPHILGGIKVKITPR